MYRAFLLAVSLACGNCFAQTFPQYFSRETVGGAIATPTAIAFAPDGRIFVAQQNGQLRVIKTDVLLATPFVSLTVDPAGERGLLGIAFDPDFTTNNYIYLYYTVPTAPIHNRISRFTADGDVAVPGSEQIILELDNLSGATNHNGGAMAFGPDGKLYVAIGENANGAHAQNLDTYHGKFLRINKNGSAPPDNPFPAGTAQRTRVWSYGLRNPFTFSIQPGTGRIFLNDVGQVTVEEVNDATTGGLNFGWPATEGPTTNPAYTSPVYSYLHTGAQPAGCAITGGTFFNPNISNYPSTYVGKYFFTDYCSQFIYWFDPTQPSPVATLFGSSVGGLTVALEVGPDGKLYYLSRTNSRLYRIAYNPPSAPLVATHPVSTTLFTGQTLTLSVVATGTSPITYQWQRNGVDIPNAVFPTLTIASVELSHAGDYGVRVTNSVGSVYSNIAVVVVQSAPTTAQITAHPESQTVEAGMTASFSVTATGTAPITYQWQKGGVNINAATSAIYTIESTTISDQGSYRVVITNPAGTVTSLSADLVVTPPNQKPQGTIIAPAAGSIYRAATAIVFLGAGTDAEDGTLPASAFQWNINFHHDTHKHDQPALEGVKSGSFMVPNRGETSANVWYRFILTVTDSKGLTDIDSLDVIPKKSTLRFRSDPPGLPVILDGQPLATPADVVSVVGIERDIDAVAEQEHDGNSYMFVAWSSGGAASQSITTPENDATYTAVYSIVMSSPVDGETIALYPNPASDRLFFTGKIGRAGVVDAMGRHFDLVTVEGAEAFDISALAPGIYTIRIEVAGHNFVKRLAIRR